MKRRVLCLRELSTSQMISLAIGWFVITVICSLLSEHYPLAIPGVFAASARFVMIAHWKPALALDYEDTVPSARIH